MGRGEGVKLLFETKQDFKEFQKTGICSYSCCLARFSILRVLQYLKFLSLEDDSMTFGKSIATCMAKYAVFSGRASRSEYWWFYLFTILMSWGASVVGAVTVPYPESAEMFSIIASLVFFLPLLAAATRRLHDTGRSGWWQLLCLTVIGVILVIVWLAMDTEKSDNKYGPYKISAPVY